MSAVHQSQAGAAAIALAWRRAIVALPARPMKRADITDLMVCTAAWLGSLELLSTLDVLVTELDAPPKVALAAIERAYDRGLVDIGVSAACCFLTDEGAQLLREAKR